MQAAKWNRIHYMPATPLYPDKPWVTESEEHRALARRAAGEGMVLLKNEQSLLPFAPGTKLAVFGKAQIDYVKGGGGSGDTVVSYVRNIAQGLQEKQVTLFEPLTKFYEEDVAKQRKEEKQPGMTKEPALTPELLEQARAFTDTAVITICRFSGEGWDRTGKPYDGDYYLSREEEAMADQVIAAFPKVAVVLNTGGMMDTLWFKDNEKVQAALLAWQGGMEGGGAVADVLCGDVCPSGHLTDTFAVNFDAYPSSAGFFESEDYVVYEEDIYVGYRYFSTIPGAAEKVCYPFGFGLSYTTFEQSGMELKTNGDQLTINVDVVNTGKIAGRQVVQVYASAPQGRLGKPAKVLTGFAKTGLLQPGEKEKVSVNFPVYAMASYDDTGKVQRSAYVLEAGDYSFYVGENVRDAVRIEDSYTVSEDRVLEQLSAKCVPHDIERRLCPDGSYEKISCEPYERHAKGSYPFEGQSPLEWIEPVRYSEWKDKGKKQFIEVFEEKITLDEYLEDFSAEELVHLLGGQPNRGIGNTFGFGNLPRRGIPNVMTADGPAGLRTSGGVCTTAFPCATLIACTWDTEIAEQIGYAAAEELLENGIGVWLAPAMNIHRSPLCGRNFEYYSEDPLLSGKMAAAVVKGIQKVGVAGTIKHFCCNNKETNRTESDSRLSERALREIYLKGFEICVKEAKPYCIMTAYNLLNGHRTSEDQDLLTGILRGEWKFDGLVMTDWYNHAEHWRELKAGNDIKMGCGDEEQLLSLLKEKKITREELLVSTKRLLEMILRLA